MPNADTLIQVIQVAAVSGTADGARSISTLLLRGLPPRAAAAALDALSILGRPEGAPAVLRFLTHHRASLRRHAVAAAQALHTPELVRALAARLGDPDEHVRLEAANALAEVGDSSVVGILFDAFEHDLQDTANANVGRLAHDCARAIAHAGSPEELQRLLGFLRRAPFNTMSDSMRLALQRTDLPTPFKLRVVAAIGDLATREVKHFLETLAGELPARDASVAAAARAAAERISE